MAHNAGQCVYIYIIVQLNMYISTLCKLKKYVYTQLQPHLRFTLFHIQKITKQYWPKMLLEFVLHSSGAVLQPTVPGCLMLKASFSTIWSLNGLFPQWIFQFPACHVQTFSHWTTVLHQFQEPVRNSRKTTIMCEKCSLSGFLLPLQNPWDADGVELLPNWLSAVNQTGHSI